MGRRNRDRSVRSKRNVSMTEEDILKHWRWGERWSERLSRPKHGGNFKFGVGSSMRVRCLFSITERFKNPRNGFKGARAKQLSDFVNDV